MLLGRTLLGFPKQFGEEKKWEDWASGSGVPHSHCPTGTLTFVFVKFNFDAEVQEKREKMWSGGDIHENKKPNTTHSFWGRGLVKCFDQVSSHPPVFPFLLPKHATDLKVSP